MAGAPAVVIETVLYTAKYVKELVAWFENPEELDKIPSTVFFDNAADGNSGFVQYAQLQQRLIARLQRSAYLRRMIGEKIALGASVGPIKTATGAAYAQVNALYSLRMAHGHAINMVQRARRVRSPTSVLNSVMNNVFFVQVVKLRSMMEDADKRLGVAIGLVKRTFSITQIVWLEKLRDANIVAENQTANDAFSRSIDLLGEDDDLVMRTTLLNNFIFFVLAIFGFGYWRVHDYTCYGQTPMFTNDNKLRDDGGIQFAFFLSILHTMTLGWFLNYLKVYEDVVSDLSAVELVWLHATMMTWTRGIGGLLDKANAYPLKEFLFAIGFLILEYVLGVFSGRILTLITLGYAAWVVVGVSVLWNAARPLTTIVQLISTKYNIGLLICAMVVVSSLWKKVFVLEGKGYYGAVEDLISCKA